MRRTVSSPLSSHAEGCDKTAGTLSQVRSVFAGLKLRQAALVALVAALLCLASTAALANGRLPGATGLAINPSDDTELLLGLTYGLALSRDRGASWSWMCEQQIEGNGGDVDPAMVMTGDGTLVVLSLTNGGVLVSRDDGCSFERAMGPLQGQRGVDLTLDLSQPGRVLALMSTIVDIPDAGPLRFRNFVAHSFDHGRNWEVLAELPDDMWVETIEVAPSDPNRIYVSGTASAEPLRGIVQRSDDGGVSWSRSTVELPRGSGSLFVSGIHPTDPDRVWFRVPGRGDIYGVLPCRLWLSMDGGTTFDSVGETKGGMFGFAVSPDGDRVAYGGPLDGLFLAPSDASATPSKLSNLRVQCLRWNSSGLFACASEPTDPYSLGYAAEPTQAFVPLWHRADTCRDACPPLSSLEKTCRQPWEELAPYIGADNALCDLSSVDREVGETSAASRGAGSAAPEPTVHASDNVHDAGDPVIRDATRAATATTDPTQANPTSRSSGCTVALSTGVKTSSWPVSLWPTCLLMYAVLKRKRRRLVLLSLAFACLLAACGGGSASNAGSHATQHGALAGHGGPLDDDFKGCPEGIPMFKPGLEAVGSSYALHLVEAMPGAPERYSNRWTLDVVTLDGAPAAGVQLARGETFMPIHGHDGRVPPKIDALSEPGRFAADPINFTMRGPWEVRFWLRADTAAEDYIVFHVCVAQ